MKEVLCTLLNVYVLVLFGRAILSWFPLRSDSGLNPVRRVLVDLTEPVLAPLRRVIPPAGIFDLSFMVLFFAIFVVLRAMNCPALLF